MTVPSNYISGTPFDTAAWGVTGGASYNVQSNAASDYYPRNANQFTFSGTGSFAYYLVPNPYPNTSQTLSVSVFPQTATSVSISLATGSITIALTPSAWNPISFNFISYGSAAPQNIIIGPGVSAAPTAAEVGTLQTTNWQITLANKPATLIRSSLFVPYGQIHTDDILLAPGVELSVYDTLNQLLALRNYSTYTLNSSTWTTVYTVVNGNHGWIKINAQSSATVYSMVSAYFERTDKSYTSLTQMASSGNAAQGALNTTNTGTGTMQITLQLSGNNIQAKSVPASLAVAVRVTIF